MKNTKAAASFTIVIIHGLLKCEEATASSASMLVTPLYCHYYLIISVSLIFYLCLNKGVVTLSLVCNSSLLI